MPIFKKLFLIVLFVSSLSATWFENVIRIIKQPDGESFQCFVTGDQYLRRLHDENNFTILLDIEDGYYYYAESVFSEKLVPSDYKVGSINPELIGIEAGLSLSHESYLERKEFYGHESGTRPERDAPSTGEIAQINVFIRFADDPDFPQPRSYYDAVFQTDLDEPSLKHYFLDISHDSLLVNTFHYPGSFTGSNSAYVDDFNRGHYQPYSTANLEGYNGDNERAQREHSLLSNALNSISTNISPLINVDANNDGLVDAVSFVIYGSPGDWADLLWPHRWSLYGEDVIINGSQVYDYLFMLSESWYFNVGVLCHEFGHVLGAPDYYHYDGGGAPTPVGGWDVMASNGNPPQFPSAFTRWKYFNWGEITEITQSGTYTLNSLHEQTNNAFKIASPNSDTEYFVFEYRKQEGMYDENAPGNSSGLVAYRINPNAGNGNAQGPPDEVYVYRPGGTLVNNGNFDQAPFSADYGRTEFNDNTDPSCYLYNEGNSADGGINIYNITGSGETISFSVSFGVPELSTDPISLNYEINPGESQSQVLAVSNSGDEETVLNYEISIGGAIPFENPLGGPDEGDYFWTTLSEEEPGSDHDWIDLSEIGLLLPLYHNDQFSQQIIELPFEFTFFEESYNFVEVNANGWIGWTSANETVWLNDELPSSTLPRPAIFGFFDDLNPQNDNGNSNSAGEVYYHVNNERAVIWFDGVVRWNTTDWGEYDFQIVLYSDGAFAINYQAMNGTLNSGTVGFQNSDGTQGTQIVANEEFIGSNMTVLVEATENNVPWALLTSEENELAGTLNGQESSNFNIQVLANDLEPGNYGASVNITSSEASSISVPIDLTVLGGVVAPELPVLDISGVASGIISLPANVDTIFSNLASRYTHIEAPNGDVIQFLIQDDFSEHQVLHVRKVLEFYLLNIPESEWGANKSSIAASIASNNAILFLLNDEDEYENPYLQAIFEAGINGQDLLSIEVHPEGTPEYISSSRRDATYEEVLHYVHGYGIQLAMPWMQSEIIESMNVAIENGYYSPLNDLPSEDYDEEYFAMGLECYLGLWAHDPSGDGFSGNNEYSFNSRENMEIGDPLLFNLIKGFFGEFLLYTPVLPDNYNGTFTIALDPEEIYTLKSQYLVDLTLSGENNSNLIGNDLDNHLTGNAGFNYFEGQKGDDLIRGNSGTDRAIYIGDRDEYIVLTPDETGDSSYQIIDLVPGRNGVDNLYDVEEIEFDGNVYTLNELLELDDINHLPVNFSLSKPYPNPFNPVTSLRFEIPSLSLVNISIYDLSGHLIKILTEKKYDQGRYELDWNAQNNYGKVVPTGIYFIKFTSKAFTQTRKILFLK